MGFHRDIAGICDKSDAAIYAEITDEYPAEAAQFFLKILYNYSNS
jgi:hypothetical protein